MNSAGLLLGLIGLRRRDAGSVLGVALNTPLVLILVRLLTQALAPPM